MKKSILVILLMLAICLGFVGAGISSTAKVTANSIDDAKKQIEESKKQQKELQDKLNKLAGQKDAFLEKKSYLDEQINAINREIEIHNNIINALSADILDRQKKLEEAEEKYNQNIDAFRKQARATYEKGNITYFEVLCGSKSFSDFLLSFDRAKQVALYEKTLLDTIQTSIETIKTEKEEIEKKKAEQEESLNALKASEEELKQKRKEMTKEIEAIKQSEAALAALQQKEADEEKALNALMEKMLKEEESKVQYQQGEWLWPVAKARYNYISSPYGWRTIFGSRSFHYAIDIAAPGGTPIYASKSGVVKSAKWVTTGGGWQVCIDHGGTYYTYYNHMQSRPIVSSGQQVKRGQVIGYVGMTGTATGNHLDFKIYYQGKAQDPAKYVKNPY